MSHNDATRLLSVIQSTIDKNTKSGAGIEVTYGQVFGLSDGEASVYLAGSRELALSEGIVAEPDSGFRVPSHLAVAASDYVRVSIDSRGHRWVDEVLPDSLYAKLVMDVNRGTILLGSGSATPDVNLYRSGAGILKTDDRFEAASSNIRGLITIPFVFDGPLTATGTVDLPYFSTGSISQMRIPFPGQVVGISVSLVSSRSAGDMSIQAYNGSGTPTLVGPAVTIDATTTNNGVATAVMNPATVDFGATNFVRLRVTTNGFAPTTNAIKALLYIALAPA